MSRSARQQFYAKKVTLGAGATALASEATFGNFYLYSASANDAMTFTDQFSNTDCVVPEATPVELFGVDLSKIKIDGTASDTVSVWGTVLR